MRILSGREDMGSNVNSFDMLYKYFPKCFCKVDQTYLFGKMSSKFMLQAHILHRSEMHSHHSVYEG